jgi:DNA-directed RNA polymerase specialized sigma24 family protein
MKLTALDDFKFAEDVAWLRSFNMADDAIARRLGISTNTFQKRLSRARAESKAQ